MGRKSRQHRLAGGVTAVALAALAVFVGVPAAQASGSAAPAVTTSFSVPGELNAVAATSPTDVWAVGDVPNPNQSKPHTLLIVHWNGVRWTRVTVPHYRYGQLFGVAVVSKDDAWAVGANEFGFPWAPFDALVLHWNGSTWRPVQSLLKFPGVPEAVTATAKGVWVAVGADTDELLHYAGGRWTVVPVAKPATGTIPIALALTGSNAGWFGGAIMQPVGSAFTAAYILRWNGKAWQRFRLPISAPDSEVDAIAVLPGGGALAVGLQEIDPYNIDTWVPLTLRWDGKAWRQVSAFIPGAMELYGVAVIPGGTAWAVGIGTTAGVVIARWTGTTWRSVPANPADTAADQLYAVTATSATDAWAVGAINPQPGNIMPVTVIMHWNGKTWQ